MVRTGPVRRLGVIGCGGHAVKSHILTAPQASFELRAVFDPDKAVAARAVGEAGLDPDRVAVFDSAEALLGSGLADAVVITSPDRFHAHQLQLAVEHGTPTLVDKPLAVDAGQMALVRQTLGLATARGVPVTSCHPRRFDPPYMWVVDNVAGLAARLGRLMRVELDFSYHVPSAVWKHRRSLMLDHFPHEIDFLRFMVGDVPVQAWLLADNANHYAVAGTLGNVTFHCAGTRMLERTAFPEEIRLRFARGACTVNTETGVATIHDHEGPSAVVVEAGRTDHTVRVEGVMRDFRRVVDGDRGVLSLADLEVNTGSVIALHEVGHYVDMGTRTGKAGQRASG